jgi:[ribosomal protein S5]-alanine N-acetyltransferase
MLLLPIKERIEDNEEFTNDPSLKLTIQMTIDFYKKVGFIPPWIGYYVEENGNLIGTAGFKGPPINETVEIAYGTIEKYRNQGFGTTICRELVELSLKTNPSIKITARTFLKENFSTRILVKNHFICIGTVNDPEDGEVWEWLFKINE